MTLAEMATRATGSSGRLECPRCHCADFRTYGTNHGHVATFRYKQCRHCGAKLITSQQPEQFVRSVDSPDDDDDD